MTKKLLFILALSIHCFFSYAQQTVNIPLEKGQTVLHLIELKDDGFIIKTGKDGYYTINRSWNLSYFTKDLEQKWEVSLEHKGYVVASPSGSYIYNIEYINPKDGRFSKVSQINGEGKVKTFELEPKDILKYSSQIKMAYLCDEEYLYLISAEDQTRKYPAKLHYYKVKHTDFKSSKVEIDLPTLPSDDDRWKYAGHNNENIWLAAVLTDKKHETLQTKIVSVSWQGKIQENSITINSDLSGLYPCESNNIIYSAGTKLFKRVDLHVGESWSQTLVDGSNNIIYTLGFYNSEINKGSSTYVKGLYTFAYDFKGQLLWKQFIDDTDAMFEEKMFNKRLPTSLKNIFAYLTYNNGIRLQIPSDRAIYTYDFSNKGEKSQFINTFDEPIFDYHGDGFYTMNDDYFLLCAPPNSSFFQYYKENFDEKKAFFATTHPQGKILIESDEKEEVKILKW